jgi:hypothetical protein
LDRSSRACGDARVEIIDASDSSPELVTWGSAILLLDAWRRRWQRPDLAERLRPDRPDSLPDEAQDWLDSL